ncbi:MAG: hypothetical protein AAGH70_03060 [Pseudomonadota bacterium]
MGKDRAFARLPAANAMDASAVVAMLPETGEGYMCGIIGLF